MNLKRYNFMTSKLFLGFIVGVDEIEVVEDKVREIHDWSTPN